MKPPLTGPLERRELRWLVLYGVALSVCAGCGGADPNSGSDLALRVAGAQLVRETFPPAGDGPDVTFVDWRRNSVKAGEAGVPISGRVSEDGFSIRLGLADDRGYWTLPVGVEDPAVADELTWSAGLDFAETLGSSTEVLLLQAVDSAGVGGPQRSVDIDVEADVPSAALAVRLEWDAQADVDLLVTDPNGVTISSKNINSYDPPAPGEPLDPPNAYREGGVLDVDSNANCVIDGLRQETVSWTAPPDGTYLVAVDLASPCATDRTSFWVSTWEGGEEQQRTGGSLFPIDSRETAAGGSTALRVMEFRVRGGVLSADTP